jgi:7-carboxy-7-deazaguanine synthase
MKYEIKEIYFTLQGEGSNTGRPAVFCRFTGCNLWSGREKDRQKAICSFCDTDFLGTDGPNGDAYETAESLARAVEKQWPSSANGRSTKFVVCTGGEPLLQLDPSAINAFHQRGFEVAIETNGTLSVPENVDWICVSPKAGSKCVVRSGHELKLVYPQANIDPAEFRDLDFERFFLQPMDGPELDKNTKLAIQYCMEHPQWELSIQSHKILGLR